MRKPSIKGDKGLIFPQSGKNYGITIPLKYSIDNTDKTFIFQ